MLSPCRFSSSTSCTSFPLNTSRHLLLPESVPALAPVRGGGFFNRYYGDFCTGADTGHSSNPKGAGIGSLRLALFVRQEKRQVLHTIREPCQPEQLPTRVDIAEAGRVVRAASKRTPAVRRDRDAVHL